MRKILIFLMAIVAVTVTSPAFAASPRSAFGAQQRKNRSIMELPLFERAVLIIKKFETLHKPKHWPYYQKKNIIQRNLNDSAIVQHISNESEDISFDNILKPDTMRTASASPDMQIAFVCLPLKKIVISSKYGVRKDPVTNKYQHHNGLDLRAKFGEPAFAMMHGVVSEVGRDGSRGNYVDIRHGHYKLSYYHLSKILVKQGQIVHPGQAVGLVGSTGRSTGAHLHLTLRKGTTSLDPLIILDYVKAMLNKLSDTRRHRF